MNAMAKIESPMVKPRYTARLAVYDENERFTIANLFIENLLPVAKLHVDLPTAIGNIYRAIQEGRMIVVERGNEIVGCTCFLVARYWFSDSDIVFEHGFFVTEKARKSKAGFVLFKALKDEAKQRNTILIVAAGGKDPTITEILQKRYPVFTTSFVVNP